MCGIFRCCCDCTKKVVCCCCTCALQSLCCILFVVLLIALAIGLGIYFGIYHNREDSPPANATSTTVGPGRLLTTLFPKLDEDYSNHFE